LFCNQPTKPTERKKRKKRRKKRKNKKLHALVGERDGTVVDAEFLSDLEAVEQVTDVIRKTLVTVLRVAERAARVSHEITLKCE